MACSRCGQPTPRSRLCKQCGLEKHQESRLGGTQRCSPGMVRYECTECNTEFESSGIGVCPECGHDRVRYAGELGGGDD